MTPDEEKLGLASIAPYDASLPTTKERIWYSIIALILFEAFLFFFFALDNNFINFPKDIVNFWGRGKWPSLGFIISSFYATYSFITPQINGAKKNYIGFGIPIFLLSLSGIFLIMLLHGFSDPANATKTHNNPGIAYLAFFLFSFFPGLIALGTYTIGRKINTWRKKYIITLLIIEFAAVSYYIAVIIIPHRLY